VHRRRVIIVLAGCVLVAIGIVAFWPGEREPEYNGKTLSKWLKIYKSPSADFTAPTQIEAADAVKHIGTNAIQLESAFDLSRENGLDVSALYGFKILGADVAPAIPELIRRVQDPNHPAIAIWAAECLVYAYGEKQTLAVSSTILNNPDPLIRRIATNALTAIAPRIFATNAVGEAVH
jgi:hypothetical protein